MEMETEDGEMGMGTGVGDRMVTRFDGCRCLRMYWYF